MRRVDGQSSVSGWRTIGTIAAAALMAAPSAAAEQPVEAWRTSPFHGAISGATGKPIPCLCRYKGRDFQLGERVCMQTQNGIVLTRCDLFLNNTTWVPSDEPCTMSRAPLDLERGKKS